MKIDWSNAGTSAVFQTYQIKIALKNRESIDEDCSPAIVENTGEVVIAIVIWWLKYFLV